MRKNKTRHIQAFLCMLPIIAMLLFSVTGCEKGDDSLYLVAEIEDLKDRPVGVATGGLFDEYVDSLELNCKNMYYEELSNMVSDLKSGTIDAAALDEPIARLLVSGNPSLMYFDEYISTDYYGFAMSKDKPELLSEYNAFLSKLIADGELEEIAARWFLSDNEARQTEEFKPATGSAGTLRFATCAQQEPFTYLYNGKEVGFELELAYRFAQEMDMTLEVQDMVFSAIIPSILSGKSDFGGSSMSITDERKKSVNFTDTHYEGGVVLVVRKAGASEIKDDEEKLATGHYGIMEGTTSEGLIKAAYPNAVISAYNTPLDAALAMKAGNVDYAVTAQSSLKNITENIPGIAELPNVTFDEPAAIAVRKELPELTSQINAVLAELKGDGSLEALTNSWMNAESVDDYPEPVKAESGLSGMPLKVGIMAATEPTCFVLNGNVAGLDVDLITQIANKLGRPVEFSEMNFAALIPALTSGRVDVAICIIAPTDERKLSVDFTDIYFVNSQVVLVATDTGASEGSFWGGLKDSFIANFVTEARWKLLAKGLGVTVLISLASAILGTLLGFAVCSLNMSKSRTLSRIAKIYVDVIRGIPVLVLLMLLYYVLLAGIDIAPVLVSIITFSVNFSAYVSEIMRTSIESVDKGQIEAASAMGFSKAQTFIRVTLPQAARMALPVYKGEFISMVKMTSVVGYVAIMDLTKASDLIRSRTFEAAFPLFAIALIYFILSKLMIWGLSAVEISIDPKRRKREVKLK